MENQMRSTTEHQPFRRSAIVALIGFGCIFGCSGDLETQQQVSTASTKPVTAQSANPSPMPLPKPPEWSNRAQRLYSEGSYAEALQVYQEHNALGKQADPYAYDRLYTIRRCYIGLGDYKRALESFLLCMSPPIRDSHSSDEEESVYYLELAQKIGSQDQIDAALAFAVRRMQDNYYGFISCRANLGTTQSEQIATVLASSLPRTKVTYPIDDEQIRLNRLQSALDLDPDGFIPLAYGAIFFSETRAALQRHPGRAAAMCRRLIASVKGDPVRSEVAYQLCNRFADRRDPDFWALKQELREQGHLPKPTVNKSVLIPVPEAEARSRAAELMAKTRAKYDLK